MNRGTLQLGEPLSPIDRAWLNMDRPTNPMMIVALLVLDAPIDRARLRELIVARFLLCERFLCVPVRDTLGARWELDRQFDVDDHVVSAALPEPRGQESLQDLLGELASAPLRPGHPPWSFHLIERYGTGSAVIVRVHHCYGDGVALVQVLLELADRNARGGARRPAPASREARGQLALEQGFSLLPGWLAAALGAGVGLAERGVHYALHPAAASSAARTALASLGELSELATLPDDPPTRLKRPLTGVRRIAWAEPLSLAEVKIIGHVLGCTVNDVLIATLAGALAQHLEAEGDSVAGLKIRASAPVNLRDADPRGELGNRFGLVFVELPIGIRHPLERLYAVHESMQALKGSPQALVTQGLLALVGSLPAAVEERAIDLFSAKASLVASNLPGPAQPLFLCGAHVSQILFWVPQAGSIGLGVSMLSYDGRVQLGVTCDRGLIADPGALVRRIGSEFERLVLLVLLGGASLSE